MPEPTTMASNSPEVGSDGDAAIVPSRNDRRADEQLLRHRLGGEVAEEHESLEGREGVLGGHRRPLERAGLGGTGTTLRQLGIERLQQLLLLVGTRRRQRCSVL